MLSQTVIYFDKSNGIGLAVSICNECSELSLDRRFRNKGYDFGFSRTDTISFSATIFEYMNGRFCCVNALALKVKRKKQQQPNVFLFSQSVFSNIYTYSTYSIEFSCDNNSVF